MRLFKPFGLSITTAMAAVGTLLAQPGHTAPRMGLEPDLTADVSRKKAPLRMESGDAYQMCMDGLLQDTRPGDKIAELDADDKCDGTVDGRPVR